MSDVRDHLQSALGSAYTLERELGGGGMSRVFVALEHALGRRVVIKVLAPELAAGEAAGMPFYTMPTWNALSAGRPEAALRDAKLIEPLGDRYPPVFGVLGYCYARTGDRAAALAMRSRLEETARTRRGYAAAVGMVHLGLGDNENALAWLEPSVREREAFFGSTSLAASVFDPLRSEPRFAALVRRINLDPAVLASPRAGRPR